MKGELKMDVNEYLPLKTGNFKGRDGTWRKTYGDTACSKARC